MFLELVKTISVDQNITKTFYNSEYNDKSVYLCSSDILFVDLTSGDIEKVISIPNYKNPTTLLILEGESLYAGFENGDIVHYNLDENNITKVIKNHTGKIYNIDIAFFDRNGMFHPILFSNASDGKLIMYNITNEIIQTFNSQPYNCNFIVKVDILYYISDDNRVIYYDLKNNIQIRQTQQYESPIIYIYNRGNSLTIFLKNGKIIREKINGTNIFIRNIEQEIHHVCMDNYDNIYMTIDNNEHYIYHYRIESGNINRVGFMEMPAKISDISVRAQGRTLFVTTTGKQLLTFQIPVRNIIDEIDDNDEGDGENGDDEYNPYEYNAYEDDYLDTPDADEEDQRFDNLTYNSDSLNSDENYYKNDNIHCTNNNVFTLESYTKEDEPIQIYMLNNQNKFEISTCITVEEIQHHLTAGKNTIHPSMIMGICTPRSHSTGKIVISLPPNNMFFTYGSIEKILYNTVNRTWFALPLFGGKKRRIGNLDDATLVSSLHCQVPGYRVYKLYSLEEIQSDDLEVKETLSDYPQYLYNEVADKYIIRENITKSFINKLIDDLIL